MSPAIAREFEKVVESHLPRLRSKARRYFRNQEDADDAVQDGLVLAWRFLDDFRGESHLSSWLTRIVITSALMLIRKRKEYFSLDDEFMGGLSYADTIPHPTPNPERVCIAADQINKIGKEADRLSPVLRRTFELFHVHELPLLRIAEVLGVPEGTVKARLSRARRRVRTAIQ